MSVHNLFKLSGRDSKAAAAKAERLPPGDWKKTAKALACIPEVQSLILTRAKNSGVIVYDRATGLWTGRAYTPEHGGNKPS